MQRKNMMRYKPIRRIVFILSLLFLWQLVYLLGVDVFRLWKPYAIPTPVGVIHSFSGLLAGRGLFTAIAISLSNVAIGYTLSVIIGIMIGFLINKVQYLNENLKPLILGLQTLPSVCWVPFAILWFGINREAIIFVIIVGSSFSIALSVENAIKNVNPIYIRAARTMGAKEGQIYHKIILPASMPYLLAGLKQGWSFAWRALMAGEMMSSTPGLGQVLLIGRDYADINQVMVVIIIIVLLGSFIEKYIFYNIEIRVRKRMGL